MTGLPVLITGSKRPEDDAGLHARKWLVGLTTRLENTQELRNEQTTNTGPKLYLGGSRVQSSPFSLTYHEGLDRCIALQFRM